MPDKAFLVDTTKCIGCKACQAACKQWNNLPAESERSFFKSELTQPEKLSAVTYNRVIFYDLENGQDKTPIWRILHKKCNHCEIPNCLSVCPAEAISKNDCWVVIDQSKCIGCGECEKKCVYNVPYVCKNDFKKYGINDIIRKGKAYKCHACTMNKREIPACAHTCPTGALIFDYRIKILEAANKRLKDVKKKYPRAVIYGKDQFGGLHVISILMKEARHYGLPENPKLIKSGSSLKTRDIYSMLSFLSFGFPSIKKALYKLSKNIAS